MNDDNHYNYPNDDYDDDNHHNYTNADHDDQEKGLATKRSELLSEKPIVPNR